jgi:hypothetical protein
VSPSKTLRRPSRLPGTRSPYPNRASLLAGNIIPGGVARSLPELISEPANERVIKVRRPEGNAKEGDLIPWTRMTDLA